MLADTPAAFGETLADAEARTDEEWQRIANEVGVSEHKVTFVVQCGDEIRGHVAGFVLSKAEVAEAEGSPIDGEGEELSDTSVLSRMWVAAPLRGQGVGQALIQAVLTWARQAQQRRVILGVTDGNELAERAYQRAGFARHGLIVPHPWLPDHQVVVMEYTLEDQTP
jgi:GNAT superfamily N-acetyltransferase